MAAGWWRCGWRRRRVGLVGSTRLAPAAGDHLIDHAVFPFPANILTEQVRSLERQNHAPNHCNPEEPPMAEPEAARQEIHDEQHADHGDVGHEMLPEPPDFVAHALNVGIGVAVSHGSGSLSETL